MYLTIPMYDQYSPANRRVNRVFNALKKDYTLIGKRHIKGWHLWLILGVAAGAIAAVALVANRSGEFSPSKAGFENQAQLPPVGGEGSSGGGPGVPTAVTSSKIFVSSRLYYGRLGGLAGADMTCQYLARAAGLSGIYKAWLSNGNTSAASRLIPATVPYTLVNGTTVARNWDDLTDGTLLAPITITETGASISGAPYVWTNTKPDGTIASSDIGSTCKNWSALSPRLNGVSGFSKDVNARWTYTSDVNKCATPAPLYCVEQSNIIVSRQPSITVVYPNGGETLAKGQPFQVTWRTSDLGDIPINAYVDVQGGFCQVGTASSLKGGMQVIFQDTGDCNIILGPHKIWLYAGGFPSGGSVAKDQSDAPFSIVAPSIAASVAIASSPSIPAQDIVAGSINAVLGGFDVVVAGEPAVISRSPFHIAVQGSGGAATTSITNVGLYDQDNRLLAGPTNVNGKGDISFGDTFTLPIGKTTLTLRGNVATSFTSGQTITASVYPPNWGITGQNSGQKIIASPSTVVSGNTMSVTQSSFTVTLDAASPSYAVTAAGRTDVPVAAYKISANGEAIRITDFALQLTSDVKGSVSPTDLIKATLWDGTAKVGEAVFAGGSKTASVLLSVPFIVPKDDSKLLIVKVDLAPQGPSQPGSPGALVRVDWDNDPSVGTQGIGMTSGSLIARTSTTDTASAGVRVYKSYPTFSTLVFRTTQLTAGRVDLFRFKIAAAPDGDIGIAKFTFHIATSSSATSSSAMITNENVYAFTDSGFSIPASGVQTDGALSAENISGRRWIDASTDLEIRVQNAAGERTSIVIPAGQTRYFAIRADAMPSGAQYSVSTQLQGDAVFVGNDNALSPGVSYLGDYTTIGNSGENDFIWRQFMSGAPTDQNLDFSNGYGLVGLPSSNTSAQTLTQ